MEGPAVSTQMPDMEASASISRRARRSLPTEAPSFSRQIWNPRLRDAGLILILATLTISIRAWTIWHTEVGARDSIGFIRTALQFEKQPFTDVVRNGQQHPGYPLVLLTVSWPIRYFLGGTTAATMQLSAQLTSALASVLLIIPMFLLGRDLLDRRAAFWGTALYQCLPVGSRILSDGLSEATYLLFTTTALWLAMNALRQGCPRRFALCGVCGGLAYLTRPEGALVVIAVGLVLLGMQAFPPWRRSWRRLLICTLSLGTAAFLIGSPYLFITGNPTNKPSGKIVLETAWSTQPVTPVTPSLALRANMLSPSQPVTPVTPSLALWADVPSPSQPNAPARVLPNQQPQAAALFALYAPEDLTDRRWWGLMAIATEVAKGYEYIAIVPVFLGLWWFRSRLRLIPGAWVLLVLCSLHCLVLWRLARVVGYVSERHVQILVLCGVFTSMAAVAEIGNWLADQGTRFWSSTPTLAAGGRQTVAVVLLTALTLAQVPESLRTLHGNRAGHRQAGLWLATHTQPADVIHDPFCWAHFYAGRLFQEGAEPACPRGYQPTQYVVMEYSDHEHNRLSTLPGARQLANLGTVVYHWPEKQSEAAAKIKVYAVPPHN